MKPTNYTNSVKNLFIFLITISGRPKRLLVVINPNAGKKKGLKVYQKFAVPLFDLCDVKADVIGKC